VRAFVTKGEREEQVSTVTAFVTMRERERERRESK
jgi:hypothetical protein